MYPLAEQTVEIACSVAAAYRFACNLERFGEWFPGVLAIVSANSLDHAVVGKQYMETVAVPLRGTRTVTITVKAAEADERFVTEGDLAPLMPRMEILFTPISENRCTVTWRMLSRNRTWLARVTMVPLARRVMRSRAAVGMSRLKRLLETNSSGASIGPTTVPTA